MRRLLALLLFALPALAAEPTIVSVSPSWGFTKGGGRVFIYGTGFTAESKVSFGAVPATSIELRLPDLLVATTPPHLPGLVSVSVDGTRRPNAYRFDGLAPAEWERLLLPVFTPPVPGAFGSEFRTELTLASVGSAAIYGLGDGGVEEPYLLPSGTVQPGQIAMNGTPGRFIYMRPGAADRLAATLRVYDSARGGTGFGTAIPIVREREFSNRSGPALTFTGIPTDARFRNTLRIYSYGWMGVALEIEIDGDLKMRPVEIAPGRDAFEPGYAEFRDFPVNAGPVTLRIYYVSMRTSGADRDPIWAFITVTDNETQQITTITPP